MITLVLHLVRLLPFLCGGHRQLALENLALRQQLAVYNRSVPRPRLRTMDRLVWVGVLPLNPSRCSEDWLRPFVTHWALTPKDTPRGPTCSVWCFKRKAEEDRGEPLTGRPATSAWRVHPAAGRILRRLACVAMMQAADHGRLHDPALVKALHSSRLRGVLLQGEVCPGTVVVERGSRAAGDAGGPRSAPRCGRGTRGAGSR